MRYPDRVNRIVKVGPMQPNSSKQYPPHLTGADATLTEVLPKVGELQKTLDPNMDPREVCEKFWFVLKPLYVVDPANAAKIKWERCDLPNERNFMKYFGEQILPSIIKLFSRDTGGGEDAGPDHSRRQGPHSTGRRCIRMRGW